VIYRHAACAEADPMGGLSPHQGINGASIGVVEAPDETSALKAAIEGERPERFG
jgi:hypothetical protein